MAPLQPSLASARIVVSIFPLAPSTRRAASCARITRGRSAPMARARRFPSSTRDASSRERTPLPHGSLRPTDSCGCALSRRARNAVRSLPFNVLDAGTHWFWMGEPTVWEAQCLRPVENFCDVTHFSITHLDTFGNPDGVRLEPTRAERGGWSVRFDFDYPVFDPNVAPSEDRQSFSGRFQYDVQLPCSVLLGGASGPGSVMFIHSTPLDVDRSMVLWGCAFPLDVVIDDAQYAVIEEAVWAPDRAMVRSQDPIGLPLGSRDELHLPMDRFALAYRRALADLGVPSSIPHNAGRNAVQLNAYIGARPCVTSSLCPKPISTSISRRACGRRRWPIWRRSTTW